MFCTFLVVTSVAKLLYQVHLPVITVAQEKLVEAFAGYHFTVRNFCVQMASQFAGETWCTKQRPVSVCVVIPAKQKIGYQLLNEFEIGLQTDMNNRVRKSYANQIHQP